MERAIRLEKHVLIPLRIRSLMTNMRQRILSGVNWLVSLSGKAKTLYPSARRVNDMIPHAGIVVGALAFGIWWNSFAAGLFACIILFFLAGIYKATARRVPAGTKGARSTADRSQSNTETLAAIENLRSWVANETSPTEESAKASCAVLLEAVAGTNNR